MLKAFGPAIPPASPQEMLRAGIGVTIGMALTALFITLIPGAEQLHIRMWASLGATATLVFAVPNSPLAQPWSTFMGNCVSALLVFFLCLYIADNAYILPIAVGLSIAAMIAMRALHPPGGAIAAMGALDPIAVQQMGYKFLLSPALGSMSLIFIAICYAKLTGRHYPLRQFPEKNIHGTADQRPTERLGLSKEDLEDILSQYRQSLNLGVEDLARLISAVEIRAASHRTGPLTAGDVMSRDLVTVTADTPLRDIAQIFRTRGFTSLPVVDHQKKFLGVIFQLHLIRKAHDSAFTGNLTFRNALSKILDPHRQQPLYARDIMATHIPTAADNAPVSSLLPALADGECDAVPILEDGFITGIVTRTDMIAALARQSLASIPLNDNAH